MKLNQLRDVLAVAERGSLRAAARHLGLAQSALTRSIRELERELDIPIFQRQSTGVAVTPMGQLFIRRAAAVRSELQRARDELDQMRGKAHGYLSVCLATVPHIALMPYALPAFRARYPDVLLDLREGLFPEVETALRAGTIDLYVGPRPIQATSPDLVVEELFDVMRVVLCRKGHPLAQARSLRDLVDAQWLATSVTFKTDEEFAPQFAAHGLPKPRVVVQGHSALSIIVALAYSDLLSMLPVQWADFPLTRDMLHTIDVVEPLQAPPTCIVRRSGLPLTAAGEYFCDMLRRASEHEKQARGQRAKPAAAPRPARRKS